MEIKNFVEFLLILLYYAISINLESKFLPIQKMSIKNVYTYYNISYCHYG